MALLNLKIRSDDLFFVNQDQDHSCSWFLDVANCRHYIAACILLGFVDENDREFIIARGRGRPKQNQKRQQKHTESEATT